MNTTLIAQLQSFVHAFNQLNALITQAQQQENLISSLKRKRDAVPPEPASNAFITALVFWGMTAGLYAILWALGELPAPFAFVSDNEAGLAINIMLVVVVLLIYLMITAGVCAIVEAVAKKIKPPTYGPAKKVYEQQIVQAQSRQAALEKAAVLYVADNFAVFSVVPQEEWYPEAVNFLLRAAQTGRADSMKEALLQLDEQRYRWNMENMMASINASQQQQIARMQLIAGYAAATTCNTGATAWNTFWLNWKMPSRQKQAAELAELRASNSAALLDD